MNNAVVGVGGAVPGLNGVGITVYGGRNIRVTNNLVDGVTGSTGRAVPGHLRHAVGIWVEDASALLSGNQVDGLEGGRGDDGAGHGGNAIGVYLLRAGGSVLNGNSVLDAQGGAGQSEPGVINGGSALGIWVVETTGVTIDGAGNDRTGEPTAIRQLRGGAAGGSSGAGGYASGVYLLRSSAVSLAGLRISDLYGAPSSGGRRGGPALGVYLEWSGDLTVTDLRINGLAGGVGDPGASRGPTFGFLLGRDLFDVLIDETNLVEGEPGFIAYDIPDVQVEDLSMQEPVATSNLGRIVLVRSSDVVVSGNHVVGPNAAGSDLGGVGEDAVGIRLEGISGVATVRGNLVERVTGGRATADGLRRGMAVGIRAIDCDVVELAGNTIRRLDAAGEEGEEGGGAVGVWVNGSNIVANSNLITSLEGSGSTAFHLDPAVQFADLFRNTFYDFKKSSTASSGIFIEPGPIHEDITVSDSIFESMEYAVNAEAGDASVNHVATRNISVEEIEAGAGNYGPDIIAIPAGAPSCLEQAALGRFALRPGSVCINAGDPGRGCGAEPGGEDCAPDLGHLAGTAEAQP